MNGGVSSLLKSNQKAQSWKWAQYRSGGNFVKDCVAKSIVEVMVTCAKPNVHPVSIIIYY